MYIYIMFYLNFAIDLRLERQSKSGIVQIIMCILMATTAHPDYDLVLISNRDEFFERKTGASRWDDQDFVLCPTDDSLLKQENNSRGTWFGVNREGKFATILNLKLLDETVRTRPRPLVSRGTVPVSFLSKRNSTISEWDDFTKFKKQYSSVTNTGDFNLFYGDCTTGEYRIIDSLGNTFRVLNNDAKDAYMVISNDIYQEDNSKRKTWGKIKLAKEGLREMIMSSKADSEATLIAKCFALASSCPFDAKSKDEDYHLKALELTMNTIFTPPLVVPLHDGLGCSMPSGKYYGTRSQIVVLVHKGHKRVKYIERTLYSSDNDVNKYGPKSPKGEIHYDFTLPQ